MISNLYKTVRAGTFSGIMALIGCGDEADVHNHYYVGGGNEETSGSTGSGNTPENPCGNSPIYGKHLWEIQKCRISFTMEEDCSVTIAGEGGKRDFGSYDGLEINMVDYGVTKHFDPAFRFSSAYPNLNAALDEHSGYVLQPSDDCTEDHPDDCAFIPLSIPYENQTACQTSEYFVGNY